MSSLVQITKQLHEIESKIIENQGEITPELEEEYTKIDISRAEKIDAYHAIMQRCDVLAHSYVHISNQYRGISSAFNRFQGRLKDNLKQAMSFTNTTELNGNDFAFKLSKRPDRLEVFDESLVPEAYKRPLMTVEIDKEKLIEDLKKGITVPGACLSPVSALLPQVRKARI